MTSTPHVTAGAVVAEYTGQPIDRATLDWAADHAARAARPLVVLHRPADRPRLDTLLAEVARRHPDLEVIALEGPAPLDVSDDALLLAVGAPHALDRLDTRLVRRAGCPVAVVPEHHPGLVRRGVLVGLPAGRDAEPVLDFAYAYASLHDLPLTLLHATHDATDADLGDRERWLAEAMSGHGERFPDVMVERLIVAGRPTPTLLHHAEARHLLVVGRHTRVGLQDPLVGHVHSTIVGRSPCPIVVVPLAKDE